MMTRDFLKASGDAAALFMALIRSTSKAKLSADERTARIEQIMDAYNPQDVRVLPPHVQLRRLRRLRHAWRARH